MSKNKSLNISLTDELKEFVTVQSGQGTMFSTPSEYVRNLIRLERDKQEARAFRNAVIEGYEDVAAGRTTIYSGDLKSDLRRFQQSLED